MRAWEDTDDYVFTRDDGEDRKPASQRAILKARGNQRVKLRRAGVAEGVIMKIGGWKTRSVFVRYAIVSQDDIHDAMRSLQAKQTADNAEAAAQQRSTASSKNEPGHDSGTIGKNLPENSATERAAVLPN